MKHPAKRLFLENQLSSILKPVHCQSGSVSSFRVTFPESPANLQSLIDATMLEAASLVLDHRGASGCAVKFIWTRMPHAVSEERCAASCDASAIEHERGIGRLHGGRGFAAKTDNVENGVSCGAICGRCTHRLSKPQVGWYFMTADPCVCPISTKHAKITSFPWT